MRIQLPTAPRGFKTILLMGLVASTVLQATPIDGQLWRVPDAIAQNATPGNVPAKAPDVTFNVNSPLDFTVAGTILQFLESGGAYNIIGSPALLNSSISPVLIRFTGQLTVSNGDTFTVTHDDGITLVIGGITVIGDSGKTPIIDTTEIYNGPSGTFPFTLVYGECCQGEAVLQMGFPSDSDVAGVPEPSSILMMATGVLALGLGSLRRYGPFSK